MTDRGTSRKTRGTACLCLVGQSRIDFLFSLDEKQCQRALPVGAVSEE